MTISIRVHNQLDAVPLKEAWCELYDQSNLSPQSSYEWNRSWWNHFGGENRRQLCIIEVYNSKQVLAIAPFMIERAFCFRQLKFLASGLTDFHDILIRNTESKTEIISSIFEYLSENSNVDLINLEQVSSETALFVFLSSTDNHFKNREMISCPVVNFSDMSLADYFQSVSKNQRQGYKKKKRRLEKEGNFIFQSISSNEIMIEKFDEMFDLHVCRWDSVGGNSKFVKGVTRNFLFDVMSKSDALRAYVLTLNGTLIAYRLGMVRNKTFYDWNTSYDPEYSYFSTGLVSIGMVIEDLISNEFEKLNFMRGNYDYKRRWMTDNDTITNFQFLCPVSPVRGRLACRYFLKWKWLLKKIIQYMKNSKTVFKRLKEKYTPNPA